MSAARPPESAQVAPGGAARSAKGASVSLVDGVLGPPGATQRRAMAKAITLLESTRVDHRAQADVLLNTLLPYTGRSLRIGLSGVPGVGKSTFIEALGLYLIGRGHRVAVLAVDPSSSVSGGSILGDKTRMERLSMDERAYIRPSPASGTLGGVAEKTREALLVCEAAGFDVVLVETVGVGQSETAVAGMTDLYVLLQLPNAGDDLQAIKKGVMELADLVVINKADLDSAAATRAQAQITSSLRLFSPHGHGTPGEQRWQPQVMQLSALKADGIDRFWAVVSAFRDQQTASGALAGRRRQQAEAWMWERVQAGLKQRFMADAAVREALAPITAEVLGGQRAASAAARELLGRFAPESSAQPGIHGLHHINLRAPAALLLVLRDFYRDVLGFEPGPRPAFASRGHWLYAGGRPVLHLSEQTAAEVPRPIVRGEPPSTFDHVAFAGQAPQAVAERLRAHGVAFEVSNSPLTRQHQFFLNDPAGNGVEINFHFDGDPKADHHA
jgi:LAO/AO transport system kinase